MEKDLNDSKLFSLSIWAVILIEVIAVIITKDEPIHRVKF